jgi:hypothetical protein
MYSHNKNLIGITGHACSGKDTVADFILEQRPGWYERKSFAAALKRSAENLLDFAPGDADNREIRKQVCSALGFDFTLARFLQLYGEALRTGVSEDFWVNILFAKYDPQNSHWIITDVRHPNEADAIRRRGGVVIKVVRQTAILTDGRDSAHPSEANIDRIVSDRTILNIGTIEDLKIQVQQQFLSS